MAITRTQIARQLYRYGGDTMGGPNDKSNNSSVGGNRDTGSDYGQFDRAVNRTKNNPTTTTTTYDGDGGVDLGLQKAIRKQKIEKKKKEARDLGFRTTGSQVYSPPSFFQSLKNKNYQSSIDRNKYLALKKTGLLKNPGFTGFTTALIDGLTGKVPDWAKDMTEEELNEMAFDIQGIKDYGKATYNYNLNPTKKGSGSELLGRTFDAQDILDSGEMTQSKYEELFPGPILPTGGDGSSDPCRGPNPPAYCFTGIRSAAPAPAPTTTQQPGVAYRFMADGGIANTEVSRQNYFVGGIIKKATKAVKKIGSKVNRARKKVLKNPYVQTAIALYAPYAIGSTGFMAGASPFMRQAAISGLTQGGLQLASGQGLDAKGILRSAAISGALGAMNPAQGAQAATTGADKAAMVDYSDMSKFNDFGLGGSGGAANIQGGIPSANVFDYESAAYGIKPLETSKFTNMVNAQALEKVDPKVIDTLSKTDPKKISKLAELAEKIDGSKIGGALLGDGKGGISALKAIGLASALPLLGVGAPEEDDEGEPYRGEGIDIAAIRGDPYSYTAPRFMAEGGSAEPVAKKVMPLLDMDGQEMDLRAEGGFVPIGRMEKADDVPARLSKNEFVFTAEAVRNAGDGDIDKGAEVMYNMMKNLESGGDVSEESQGLDGAKQMFQTSQRLGEVI